MEMWVLRTDWGVEGEQRREERKRAQVERMD